MIAGVNPEDLTTEEYIGAFKQAFPAKQHSGSGSSSSEVEGSEISRSVDSNGNPILKGVA